MKYRVWDNVNNEWITDCDLYMLPDGRVYAGDAGNPPLIEIKPECVSFSTGLKDKNHIEIYGGDIVRFEYGEPPAVEITSWGHDVIDGWNEEVIGAITFEQGAFMLREHLLWSMEAAGLDYSLEVLGNVREHPHLLKGE